VLPNLLTGLFLLALTVVLFRRGIAGYAPPAAGLAVLSRAEAAVVAAAAEALFPGVGALPVSGRDAHLPHSVDRHLAALPQSKRLQIRALLLVIEHIPLLVPADEPGGRRRFSSLPSTARASVLQRLCEHRRGLPRLLFTALRAVLVLGYLGHPANLWALGVAPFEIQPGVSDAELLFPRVGGLVSSIAFSPSDRTDPTRLGPLDPHGPRHRAYARSSRDSR